MEREGSELPPCDSVDAAVGSPTPSIRRRIGQAIRERNTSISAADGMQRSRSARASWCLSELNGALAESSSERRALPSSISGDGVLCLEFHSKMNALGEDIVTMIYAGVEETERNFEAMVIANQGENFSAGANLMLVLLAAQEGEWDELNLAIHRFQQATWRSSTRRNRWWRRRLAARSAADARSRCTPRVCRLRRNCTWAWWRSGSA